MSVRRFPTGAKYVEALQHPGMCFKDPDLKNGTVEQTPVLGPKPISGNFASVFSVTAPDGRRYAVKCFTRDTSSLGDRYAAVSGELGKLDPAQLSQPWPVGFDYLDQGVLVGGEWFPVVKMTWVQGTGLLGWLSRNATDPAAVTGLARRFAALVADLEEHGIAHGDLQHGNILVAGDGTLRLVDYDGMYVPALRGQRATENGHRNYQPPARSAADFGPTVDRFSAWVIHLALTTVATDSRLWDQLHEKDGEFLILSEPDFKDPAGSYAWGRLLAHPDPALRALADQVRGFLSLPVGAVPALSAQPVTVPAQRSSVQMSSGVPSWMSGHLTTKPSEALPTLPTRFADRRLVDLLLSVFALLSVSAPGAVTAAGAEVAVGLPPVQAVAVLVSATAVGAGRRLRPEVRSVRARRRDLRREVREAKSSVQWVKQLTETIRMQQDSLTKEEATAVKRGQELQIRLRDGQAKITIGLNGRTKDINAKLAALPAKEDQQVAAALAPAVATHLRNALSRTPIRAASRVPGMGEKCIQSLVRSGFHTAADFVGVRYEPGSYGGRQAFLLRPGGQRVGVHLIGESRAAALEVWRQGLEDQARRTAPSALPPLVRSAIRDRVDSERAALRASLRQAETAARQQRTGLQQTIAAQQQAAAADQNKLRATAAKLVDARSEAGQQLTRAEADLARVEAELSGARRGGAAGLRMRSYLKFVVTGR